MTAGGDQGHGKGYGRGITEVENYLMQPSCDPAGSRFGRRQERVLAKPPAWSGNSSSSDAVPSDRKANSSSGFVTMLLSLHEDLCAYLFLFVEVNCISHGAASCRQLLDCLWTDSAFWKTYIGPCMLATDNAANMQAPALRESFRKWIFHLDGSWTKDFQDFVDESKRSEFGANFMDLLNEARYIVSGLMPHDSRRPISDFAKLICELLTEYNPAQLDERRAAEALAAQVERRSDVFSDQEVRNIAMALDRSIEHAILDQPAEDGDLEPDPIRLLHPLEDASDEDRFSDADDWNSLDVGGPLGAHHRHNDLFDAFDRGDNVESFWRDHDGS